MAELVFLQDEVERLRKAQYRGEHNDFESRIRKNQERIKEIKVVVRDLAAYRKQIFALLFLCLVGLTEANFSEETHYVRARRAKGRTTRTVHRRGD